MKKFVIISLIFTAASAVFLLVLAGGQRKNNSGFSSEKKLPVPSVAAVVETKNDGWKFYWNREMVFSIHYPPGWNYMHATHYNRNNLFAVVFNDIKNPEIAVGIRILDGKGTQTIGEWLDNYATENISDPEGRYILAGVKNTKNVVSGKYNGIVFDQELEDGTVMVFHIFRNNEGRIFLINHQASPANPDFPRMLDSFTMD